VGVPVDCHVGVGYTVGLGPLRSVRLTFLISMVLVVFTLLLTIWSAFA
jgi:hypothetical protein